jgi:heme/copper-type cytochrome/quinol oxidase subunit 1
MSLLSDLRGDTPLPERRRRFVRMSTFVLWSFAIGFTLLVVRIYVAIESNEIWTDYRGLPIPESALRTDLLFFLALALLSTVGAMLWMRFWRSRV